MAQRRAEVLRHLAAGVALLQLLGEEAREILDEPVGLLPLGCDLGLDVAELALASTSRMKPSSSNWFLS